MVHGRRITLTKGVDDGMGGFDLPIKLQKRFSRAVTERTFLPSYALDNLIVRLEGFWFVAPAIFFKLVDLTSENKHHGDLNDKQ